MRVAVIGGGPTGFAVARALMHEERKFYIHIIEKQTLPGGVWEYTGTGPMYRDMNTNIRKELMELTDRPFDPKLPMFVDRRDVLEYVQHYCRDIESHDNVDVHYGRAVTQVTKPGSQWVVELEDDESSEYDYVVVASGHFHTPLIPEIPGLRDFIMLHPDRLVHMRKYVAPETFRHKKMLIIGNGPSGIDVGTQLLSVTSHLSISRRSPGTMDKVFDGLPCDEVQWRPSCVKIHPETGEVLFDDGTTDKFDVIMLATGYIHRLPFLAKYNEQSAPLPLLDLPAEERVCSLHDFIFYIGDPTLAFVGLNKNVVPMPLSETQAALIARVWSGRLNLPPAQVMLNKEQERLNSHPGRQFLSMKVPEDVEYMWHLNDLVNHAQNPTTGFVPERWGQEKMEMRKENGALKVKEFQARVQQNIADRQVHDKLYTETNELRELLHCMNLRLYRYNVLN